MQENHCLAYTLHNLDAFNTFTECPWPRPSFVPLRRDRGARASNNKGLNVFLNCAMLALMSVLSPHRMCRASAPAEKGSSQSSLLLCRRM